MEADEFVVEKVVDKSFYNGKYYYEVKWEGWDSKDNSWLQKKDLQGCEELIDTYEKSDAGLKFA